MLVSASPIIKKTIWVFYALLFAAFCVVLQLSRSNPAMRTPWLVLKCSLMPVVMLQFFLHLPAIPTTKQWFYPTAAFTFGLLGDLLVSCGSIFLFGAGMVSFAIGHIFFIITFVHRHLTLPKSWLLRLAPLPVISWLLYLCVTLIPLAKPLVRPFMLAVFVMATYASVIGVMVCCALYLGANSYENRSLEASVRRGTFLVPVGALLFLASDSILSYRNFYTLPFLTEHLLMLFYASGQAITAVGLATGVQPVETGEELRSLLAENEGQKEINV